MRSAKQTILDVIGQPLDFQLRTEAWNAYTCADPEETLALLDRFYEKTRRGPRRRARDRTLRRSEAKPSRAAVEAPSGRRALVTGAARGIGAAIAERLRSDGLEVVTADRDEGCDLRFDVAADELPELGELDVCVSNAAITDTIAPAHRMTREQWDRDLAST